MNVKDIPGYKHAFPSEKKWKWNPKPQLMIDTPCTISANAQLHHFNSLHWLILKQRQGQKIEPPPPPMDSPPLLNSHQHHHFHHYMKYDRERNPTMPCKCRCELASRRHKRSACIIWPGEHHLWGDSQRLWGGRGGGGWWRGERRREGQRVQNNRWELSGKWKVNEVQYWGGGKMMKWAGWSP